MVGENADAGANVGAPVVAEDDDSDILTYTLDDDVNGNGCADSFEIDPATGRSRLGTILSWTSRRRCTYMVMVTATDPAGLNATIHHVTINVSDDANEPPAITGTVPDSFDEVLTAEMRQR